MSFFYKHKQITRALSVVCICLALLCVVPDGIFSPVESHAAFAIDDALLVVGLGYLVSAGVFESGILQQAADGLASAQEQIRAAGLGFVNFLNNPIYSAAKLELDALSEAYNSAYQQGLTEYEAWLPDYEALRSATADYVATASDGVLSSGLYSDTFDPAAVFSSSSRLVVPFTEGFKFSLTPLQGFLDDPNLSVSLSPTFAFFVEDFSRAFSSFSVGDVVYVWFAWLASGTRLGISTSLSPDGPSVQNTTLQRGQFYFVQSGTASPAISNSYTPTTALSSGSTLEIPIDYNVDVDAGIATTISGVKVYDVDNVLIREGTEDVTTDIPVNPPAVGDWPSNLTGDLDISVEGAGEAGEVLNPDGSLVYKIPFIGWIAKLLSNLWDLIKAGFNKIGEWLKSLWSSISAILSAVLELPVRIWDKFSEPFSELLDTLKSIFDAIIGFVFDLGSLLTDFLLFLSGYTIFEGLLMHYLPPPVAVVMWAFWLVAIAIGLLRMVVNR